MNKTPTCSTWSVVIALLITAATPARGQFALEQVYPGGSYSFTPNYQFHNQLFLLELEVSGWKFVRIDRVERQLDFFHLDHTFWKSVSFAMTPVLSAYLPAQDILYISEHLFDLDDGIEFMYTTSFSNGSSAPTCVTQVVDEETAGLIFDVNDQLAAVRPNYHMQQYPIQNTPAGTKLILSSIVSDSAYVYRLAGQLTSGMQEVLSETRGAEMINLFPNPASTELTVLLSAWHQNASMQIVSSSGQVVRTVVVAGGTATIDIRALASGQYICRVQGEHGRLGVGSFIKN